MFRLLKFVLVLGVAVPAATWGATLPAHDPTPADSRAYLDPGHVTLAWAPPVDPAAAITGYRVYFSTEETAVAGAEVEAFAGGTDASVTTFPVGPLDSNTQYFWRVDAFLGGPVLAGPVWQFTTEYIDIPGVIVDYSPSPASVYVGSPSMVILPDGTYVACHDWFGPGTTYNQTAVFASIDQGHTWKHLTTIDGQFWSNLFYYDGLYIVGVSGRYNNCVIRRSGDGGRTWTTPDGAASGRLFSDTNYHTAPMPMLIHNGRIWRTMEDAKDPGGWGDHFRAFMMSAPLGADLLHAANWTTTNRLSHDASAWTGTGWLEGNAVLTPDGDVVNILRVAGVTETAAIVRISADGATASFDPANDFIPFHGGANKFTIRYDPTSDRYWSLVNKERDPTAYRNHLVLVSSADLRNWLVEDTILFHPDSSVHAWQYIDWLFEGDDIVFVSRTAYDDGLGGSAQSAHNANFLTFHRVLNFRGPRVPVFDIQPQGQTVALGQPASFTVAAHADISQFQWFKLVPGGNDLPLTPGPGLLVATADDTSTLTFPEVTAADFGQYYCNASNLTGVTRSLTASLVRYTRTLRAHWQLDETAIGPVTEATGACPLGDMWGYFEGMLAQPGPDGPDDLAHDFAADTTVAGVATNAYGVLPAQDDFSLRVRFKTSEYHSAQGHLFSNNQSQTGRANLLIQNGLISWWGHLGVLITAPDRVDDGLWHTATVIRDGDDWRLYLDDELVGSQTVAGVIDESVMWMIGRSRTTQFNYEGLISDVRVYNYPLDAPADLDGDGIIGLGDFALLSAHWGNGPCHACDGADLDLDLSVDLKDLHILLETWLNLQ